MINNWKFETVRSINIDNEAYFCIDDLYTICGEHRNNVINNLDITEYIAVANEDFIKSNPLQFNISTKKIYFVFNESNSVYDEYIYDLTYRWTLIGSEKVDMSNKVNIIDIPLKFDFNIKYKLVIVSNESYKNYKLYVNKRGIIIAMQKAFIN